jgi:Uri superfamily endonuclease
MTSRGAYCLCIKVEKDLVLDVGALGWLTFPQGSYVYVGSAMNGLEARLRRHLNTSRGSYRAIHWHIDYLLKAEEVSIDSIYVRESDVKIECATADVVSERGVPVKGFGCSDCRCSSHLFRMEGCESLIVLGLEMKHQSE